MTGERGPRGPSRAASDGGRRAFGTPLQHASLAVVLVLGIGLRIGSLGSVGDRTPDEQVYTRQANVVLDAGPGGLRWLVAEFRSDPAWTTLPSPTRAGYIWLVAGVMRLTGVRDERAGAYVSCAASIASLFVLARLGARCLPFRATLVALLFFAVSPMELALARRAWQDALVGFLGLCLVYVGSELTRDLRRRSWSLAFAGIGTVGVTIKELAAVAYGLVAMWVLWVILVRRRDRGSALTLVAACSAGTVAGVAWLASAVGGVGILIETVSMLPGVTATLRYSLDYETGPAYRMLQGLWIVAPLASILCVVGLAAALLPDRVLARVRIVRDGVDRQVVGWIAVFLMVFLALPMVFPHHQNLRYLSAAFGPFYLISGLGLWVLTTLGWNALRPSPRWVWAAVASVVAVTGAGADASRFQRVFVRQGTPDLSIGMLIDAGGSAARRADVRRSGRRHPTPEQVLAAEMAASRHPSPENYLYLSLQYELAGRHEDCIAACVRALELRPDYAEAYNNIASAHASLGRWDEAIAAAEQALRMKPDFPLARNNLEHARSMKGRRIRRGSSGTGEAR